MRSTRKRTAVKADDDFLDVDSDEFEQMLEGGRAPSGKPKSSRCQSGAQSKRARTAAAAAAAAGGDSDYEPEEAADQPAAPAPKPSHAQESEESQYHSISGGGDDDAELFANASDDDHDEDYGSSKQQAKQKADKPQKKPRKKRQSTARLCLTYAKSQFKLTDRDLQELTDIEYRDNPHYANGPPMKLYLVRELEELARRKAERKAREADEKEERAATRALEARARRAAAAAAAAQKAAAFDSHTPKEERHGSVQLPDTCLSRIMTFLAGSIDLAGLRGPSAVAKDLAAAALVCWDFYHAAKAGFDALGPAATDTYCPGKAQFVSKLAGRMFALPGPASLGGWEFWDRVVQQPMQLKLPQLKDAARSLELPVTGTKAELMLRILGAFNLSSPASAPAQLLRALVLERSPRCFHWGGADSQAWSSRLTGAYCNLRSTDPAAANAYNQAAQKGAAGLREHLKAQGYGSVTEFTAAAEAAWKEQQEEQRARQRAEAERQRAEWAQRRQEQAAAGAAGMPRQHPTHVSVCRCGNAAAKACSRGCCGACCKVDGRAPGAIWCQRHNTG